MYIWFLTVEIRLSRTPPPSPSAFSFTYPFRLVVRLRFFSLYSFVSCMYTMYVSNLIPRRALCFVSSWAPPPSRALLKLRCIMVLPLTFSINFYKVRFFLLPSLPYSLSVNRLLLVGNIQAEPPISYMAIRFLIANSCPYTSPDSSIHPGSARYAHSRLASILAPQPHTNVLRFKKNQCHDRTAAPKSFQLSNQQRKIPLRLGCSRVYDECSFSVDGLWERD